MNNKAANKKNQAIYFSLFSIAIMLLSSNVILCLHFISISFLPLSPVYHSLCCEIFHNCSLFIGSWLWKLQTFQCHCQNLKTRNSGLLTVSWYNLIISEVMSFLCSDSCENCKTREKILAKCSGKSPISGYLRFQSYALEFSNV